MRSWRVVLLLLGPVALAGCADSGLPQRGFATQFFQSAIEPELNPPEPFSGLPIKPDGNAYSLNSCETVAQQRAQDAAAQDFDKGLQQKVFDATLQDCKSFRARYGHMR